MTKLVHLWSLEDNGWTDMAAIAAPVGMREGLLLSCCYLSCDRILPRDITITWQRNGKDLDVGVELGETVSNGDGTFQTTSNLTVKPEDWKSQNYTCTVQHKSTKQDIILPVKEENINIAPEVSLLQKDSSSPGVTCHVTGFYPRDIMVTWQRNGEDLDVGVELGETVPNEDRTFQTTSNLTVKPEDWKSQNYTCTVQHKSLKQDIILPVIEENIKTNSFSPEGSNPHGRHHHLCDGRSHPHPRCRHVEEEKLRRREDHQ
ncbi:hypothetical protein ANANG_G00285250 [Anguilla anguilla]|uniref:Ig-like domain-containing protein n=1 Tax=Anguilla anguilla TaxID=7936 RepID=A0A9D3RL95_ANGAN|nr:hypothetical protein ANANG_G00285250 [Anguilla anguilla]